MQKKKEGKILEMNGLNGISTLKKLQLIVSLIFILSTLAIVMILIGGWVIAGVLVLISYLMIFGLTVKLLMTKKL